MISPNPYAVIGAAEAAALLLDEAAHRLGARIPQRARPGLEALMASAIALAEADLHDDAGQVLRAVSGILGRYVSPWNTRKNAA